MGPPCRHCVKNNICSCLFPAQHIYDRWPCHLLALPSPKTPHPWQNAHMQGGGGDKGEVDTWRNDACASFADAGIGSYARAPRWGMFSRANASPYVRAGVFLHAQIVIRDPWLITWRGLLAVAARCAHDRFLTGYLFRFFQYLIFKAKPLFTSGTQCFGKRRGETNLSLQNKSTFCISTEYSSRE